MKFISIILLTGLLISCKDIVPPPQTGSSEQTDDGKIFITDRKGVKWDITHAVNKYGFEPAKFQFGLGENAIRPILNPQFLSPGDQNYPNSNSQTIIIGFKLNNDVRAYPLSVLDLFEVADDRFDSTFVAVAY